MDPVSALAPSSTLAPQPSPLHSPIPYLFGSLAALMGLIAIAYIVLACSYWKLSRNFEDVTEAVDIESGNVTGNGKSRPENYNNLPEVSDHMKDKCLVIMAGEDKPTFWLRLVGAERRRLVVAAGVDGMLFVGGGDDELITVWNDVRDVLCLTK